MRNLSSCWCSLVVPALHIFSFSSEQILNVCFCQFFEDFNDFLCVGKKRRLLSWPLDQISIFHCIGSFFDSLGCCCHTFQVASSCACVRACERECEIVCVCVWERERLEVAAAWNQCKLLWPAEPVWAGTKLPHVHRPPNTHDHVQISLKFKADYFFPPKFLISL